MEVKNNYQLPITNYQLPDKDGFRFALPILQRLNGNETQRPRKNKLSNSFILN